MKKGVFLVNIRHYFILSLFLSFCSLGIWRSWNNSVRHVDIDSRGRSFKNEMKNKNYFQFVSFFKLTNGAKSLYLTSNDLVIDNLINLILFSNPDGEIFDEDGVSTSYLADYGEYNKEKKVLNLRGSVDVLNEDLHLKAENLVYHINGELIFASKKVGTESESKKTGDTIFITTDNLVAYPDKGIFNYEGNVKGQIKRKRLYEDNIFIKSEKLTLNSKNNVILLNGSVEIKKDAVVATAYKGRIFLDNYNKNLKYFTLNDDVKVSETFLLSNGKLVSRKAVSEKLEGIASEDKYILTGYPKVFQGGDILKGNKITLRESNEVIEVDNANTSFILK